MTNIWHKAQERREQHEREKARSIMWGDIVKVMGTPALIILSVIALVLLAAYMTGKL